MGSVFMILDYTRGIIVQKLKASEVCAIAKALMVMPNPSFDIVCNNRFVTADFHEASRETREWVHSPVPQPMIPETDRGLDGELS